MSGVLVAYSSVDGHTRRICERIATLIERQGLQVRVAPLADCGLHDIVACDMLVIGAAIRYGHHQRHVATFVEQHRPAIEARPNAFFSVNVVARKPGKDTPQGNPYLRRFLHQVAWQPRMLAVFAGRIDYPRLGPLDRTVIRFIMWLTGGPTDPTRAFEFTDWARVEAFALEIAALAQQARRSAVV
jgi:menaquinone-dependent protoporphyrinogen oxidase